uniref:Mitochondrial pyruvate carrier n=1 Tax=Electrophorus electricus TaxID=8005 RepID=A0A4W4FJA2_ELEEL
SFLKEPNFYLFSSFHDVSAWRQIDQVKWSKKIVSNFSCTLACYFQKKAWHDGPGKERKRALDFSSHQNLLRSVVPSTEHVSAVSMSSCLCCTHSVPGLIWSRYCLVIIPKNWALFAVNFFLGLCGTIQLIRIWRYNQMLKQKESKLQQS